MRALLAALAVAALAASASAATLKVPQQYETIQEAVNAAAEGDTIVVSKGVYYESVSVFVPNVKIIGKKAVIDGTFYGAALSPAIAFPDYYNCLTVYGSGVTVQGMQFRNGYTHLLFQNSGCRALKNVSRNASYVGIYGNGSTGTEISGNRVVGAGYTGIYNSGSSAVITKNSVQQSGTYGIQAYGSELLLEGNVVGQVASSAGIYVGGSPATVTRNRVSDTGGNGLEIYTTEGTVAGNRVNWVSQSTGIYVSGFDNLVQGNTVAVAFTLLTVYGNGNRILDNRASNSIGSYNYGVQIGGDSLTVDNNIVDHVARYGSGFYIYNYSSFGNSVISNLTAQDTSGAGFVFNAVNGATVSGIKAVRCGSFGYEAAIQVYGSGSTFTGCSVTGGHGDGFFVSATGNTFTSCTVSDTTINGFRVYGFANTFVSCTAKGIGGQGFHNAGSSTVLTGGVYVDNRIDIANETYNGATFSGGLNTVTYDTGGELTIPEVFYYNPF